MQFQVGVEEILTEYKNALSDAQHELMMMKIVNKKLGEELEKYQQADSEKNAAEQEFSLRRLSAAVEPLPAFNTADSGQTA